MTVRQAEFAMAIATIVMSLGLMWSSTDGLSIGWVPGKGPGSGFWPFWLSVGLLLASLTTLYRWFRGTTPESRSQEDYLSKSSMVVVGTSVGALLALLIGIQLVGIYISLVFFLLFYIRFVGHHEWPTTIMLVGGIPVFIFALFEWLLQIPLWIRSPGISGRIPPILPSWSLSEMILSRASPFPFSGFEPFTSGISGLCYMKR